MRPDLTKALVLAGLLLAMGSAPLAARQEQQPAPGQEEMQKEMDEQPAEEPAAEADEAAGFRFTVDPLVLSAVESSVDTESAKFEEYRDVDSGFAPSLSLLGESADGNRTLDLDAANIGRDDARYTFAYGVSGRYSLSVDYNKIPHRFGNDGRLLWARTGDGRLEIADPTQASIQGAIEQQRAANPAGVNFAFLNNLLQPHLAAAGAIDLGLQRDRTLVSLGLGSLAGLSWGLQVDHENRKGDRALGGSFGFNSATEIPEPIDYRTTSATLAGEWNGESAGVRAGYRYSAFENDVDTLIWDNPFRAIDSTDPNAYLAPSGSSVNGSSRGIFDLAPDNQANMVFVDGRMRFAGDWFASGNLSYNVMTQDDPLLPFTLNTAILGVDTHTGQTFPAADPAFLPARDADTEVQVLSFDGRAGTRFAEVFDLTFNYRLYDYDNRSPRLSIPGYVRFHAAWIEVPRITVPYAYTRQDLGAELGWDVLPSTRLGLAWNRQSWDRDFREVASSDEDVLRLTADTRRGTWLTLQASYEIGDRSVDDYDPEAQEESFLEPEGINNQPGLRKFLQAAREHDGWNLLANFFAGEAWSFAVGVTGRDEDYDESQFGLITDEILQYNAELSFAPGEDLSLFLFGHRADRESFQRARQSGGTLSTNPADDWTAGLDETTDTWGLGATTRFAERWRWDATARWSRSDGFADFFSPPGGTPDLAFDIDNYEDIELFSVWTGLDYQVTPAAVAGLFYRYEDYTIDSFILQGLRNFLPGAILINPDLGDYQGNVFGLSLRLALR